MKLKLKTLSPQAFTNLRKLILDGEEADEIFLCHILEGFEEEIWTTLCSRARERIDSFVSLPLEKLAPALETILEMLTCPAYIREERVANSIRRSILTSEETLTLDGFLDELAHYVLEELVFQEEYEYLEEFKDRIKVLRQDDK